MPLPTGTNYPGAIDGESNGYGAVSAGQTVASAYANDQTSAILALETVVGASPLTGTPYTTVGGALAGLTAALQDGSFTFGTDTGTANAYAVAFSPALASYVAGQVVAFVAAQTSTAPSTLAVNSLSAQNLVRNGGAALGQNDIVAGQLVVAMYDGSQFQLLITAVTPGTIQNSNYIYASDGGAANTYHVVLSPATSGYTPGQLVALVAAHTNTGASTLDIDFMGGQNLVRNGGAALGPNDIVAGQLVVAMYDGSQFQLLGTSVTPATIQNNTFIYSTDSGSANAYAITISPTPPSVANGQMFMFTADNTNMGASTLSINGGSAIGIVAPDGSALTGGEILAGQISVAIYNGSQFQLVGSPASSSFVGNGVPSINDFRLTLASGIPVTVDRVSDGGGTTLYLTPYRGNTIGLYSDGTWSTLTSAEVSLDLSSLSGGVVYDIFAYSNDGAVTLDTPVAWADNNDRATALAQQDGVWVSSADATRRYVGTVYCDGSPYVSDYSYTRSLWNADNRVPVVLQAVTGPASSNTNSWNAVLYGDSFVVGQVLETVYAVGTALGQGDGSSAWAEIGIGIFGYPGAPDFEGGTFGTLAASGTGTSAMTCAAGGQPALGMNNPTLFLQSTVDSATVNLLDDGSNTMTTITTIVWM